jgi:hypothetical protein
MSLAEPGGTAKGAGWGEWGLPHSPCPAPLFPFGKLSLRSACRERAGARNIHRGPGPGPEDGSVSGFPLCFATVRPFGTRLVMRPRLPNTRLGTAICSRRGRLAGWQAGSRQSKFPNGGKVDTQGNDRTPGGVLDLCRQYWIDVAGDFRAESQITICRGRPHDQRC